MSEQLKPCPLCSEAVRLVPAFRKGTAFVKCASCGLTSGWADTNDEAIRDWNTRPADPVKQALADALKDMRLRWGNSRPCSDPTCLVCPKEIATTKAADAALKAYREEQAQ